MSSTDINTDSCCDQEPVTALEVKVETEETFYLNKETRSSERMNICQSCPELGALNRCNQCGCFMNIKVRIYSASCPLGKW
jgi:hypothetical protein